VTLRVRVRDTLPLSERDDLHNTGVGWGRDAGRFGVTGQPWDRGRFKTPSLRNVTLTAPYMHDGSVNTLEAVVDFYDRGGRRNSNLDPAIRPLRLTSDQRSDLVAFLRALEGQPVAPQRRGSTFRITFPVLVRPPY